MGEQDDLVKQEAFFRDVMDPHVRVLVDATDPWDAYKVVSLMTGAVYDDYMLWGPNAGAVFVAWAELEDVYETGKTPIADAHAALRQAGVEWLERPAGESAEYVAAWAKRTNEVVATLFDRDGDSWRSPPSPRRASLARSFGMSTNQETGSSRWAAWLGVFGFVTAAPLLVVSPVVLGVWVLAVSMGLAVRTYKAESDSLQELKYFCVGSLAGGVLCVVFLVARYTSLTAT